METILGTTEENEKNIQFRSTGSGTWLRYARLRMSLFLGAADLFSLLLAGSIALVVRMLIGGGVVSVDLYVDLIPVALLALIVYAWRGLYPAIGIGEIEELRRLSITTTLIFLSLATFTFLTKSPPKYSRSIFILAWMLSLGIVPLGRNFVRVILSKFQLWGEPVAVIGEGEPVMKVANFLIRNLKVGFRPLIVFSDDDVISSSLSAIQVSPIKEMTNLCQSVPIKTVLVVTPGSDGKISRKLDHWQNVFERVVLVDVENSTHLLWISVRNLGEFIGIEIRQNLLNTWAQSYKRVIDVVGAIIGLLFSLPIFAVVSLLIKIDSPGSVFYYQVRIGRNGKHFKMIKFRTMYRNAHALLEQYLNEFDQLKLEWEKYQKLRKDPRITRIGNILRLLSIDELPQLINVLKGDMSLVGPRPFFPEQQSIYGEAYENYVKVRPGITGMWQTYGRNQSTFAQRAQWDEYYVRNWSIWLDIFILFRTVGAVISKDGAY
jgi:Undecaprenyl-phosphate galactose phosphotransferase WbaP